MPYIHFTNEQKQRAASVDLKVFLERQGEKLIRSGPEYRMASDHSITIRGSEWYDHASEEGGGPIGGSAGEKRAETVCPSGCGANDAPPVCLHDAEAAHQPGDTG